MQDPAIDILGLTSEEFMRCAQARGVHRPAALAAYRQSMRDGLSSLGWAAPEVHPVTRIRREDGAIKFVMRHGDGLETESVILPIRSIQGRQRNTLCVSSQIGCAMGCTFCETAQMGLMKNLTASQIVAQWHAARFRIGAGITNIVFMGMGEPMDNLDAVIQAIAVFTDQNGPAIPPARISVSTVGLTEGIERLARLARQSGYHKLRLAVSVNAPNDVIRSQIMPINRSTPLARLMDAMLLWPTTGKSRVLIEYVVIPGVNDAPEHARELCEYLRPLRCTVNVIPYNPRRNSPWPAPTERSIRCFIQAIHDSGQFVKRRQTLGRNVMAACGQLGNPTIRGRKQLNVALG